MLHIARRPACSLFLFPVIFFALAASLVCIPQSSATTTQKSGAAVASARTQPASAAPKDEDAPPFHDYRGVSIGISADEARKKLGDPSDKGDKQDFYVVSDNETAQVFYDDAKKVHALSIMYTGTASGVPTCKAVLGSDAEAKSDGSMHKMVSFPKAGYWVAYSRTAGDSPMTTVTMQKTH